MGWAYGVDENGKEVGYSVEAKCDHLGCSTMIFRDVDAACGGMHGKTEVGCTGHFCAQHFNFHEDQQGHMISVCQACASKEVDAGNWAYDEDEDTYFEAINDD